MSNPVKKFPKSEMAEAIALAAKENYERDVLVLGKDELGSWTKEQRLYLEEAEQILKETGENWMPDFPQHHHIIIERN